jgi:hypothetical protein
VIVRDLFKKETNIDLFSGLSVNLSSGEKGTLEGTFWQSGKVKVRVMEGLGKETMARVETGKKKGEQQQGTGTQLNLRCNSPIELKRFKCKFCLAQLSPSLFGYFVGNL